MPKRSRSGVVSSPERVVAPISVNGGRSSVTTLRARADAERDRQLAVLHRGIERLLDRAREPVDLVDEEDRAAVPGRSGTAAISALRSSAGPDGLSTNATSELLGDDPRQRRLAEARRAGEQHVVERLAARGGGLDRDAQLGLQRLLADELVQPARAQPRLGGVARRPAAGSGGGRGRRPGVRIIGARPSGRGRSAPPACHRARRRAAPSTSGGEKPSPSRPSRASARGSSVRVDDDRDRRSAPGRPSRAARRRSARRCACRCPGTACRRAVSPAATAASSSRGGPPESTASAIFGPDALDADQQQEQVALLLGGEAVEQQRVVAHDQVA